MNKIQNYFIGLIGVCFYLLTGCSDAVMVDEDQQPTAADKNKMHLELNTVGGETLKNMALFLFYPDQREIVAMHLFKQEQLQGSRIDFFLPTNGLGTEYELFGVANFDCRDVKSRPDLYKLYEQEIRRYHSADYATAVKNESPEGGFIYVYNKRIKLSENQLRLNLARTVARLEIGIEIDANVESLLGTPLKADSICIEGVTSCMYLFDTLLTGEYWRKERLQQLVGKENKGLFYLYPSAPGEALPVIKLWCSYSGTPICYTVALQGSMDDTGKSAIVANKCYNVLIRVKGIGVSDWDMNIKIAEWETTNQEEEF